MKNGDKIGIVCCSNGQKRSYVEKIKYLEATLLSMGIQPVFSDCIYEKEDAFSGTVNERAQALIKFYMDDEIKGIFDISGGDIANGILPYLDYDFIANSPKLFWGYSDLTTVINAIYAKTGKSSVLYQIRNLIYDHREAQIANFRNTVMDGGRDLFQIHYRFIQQKEMHGIVVGGNVRCFLKLAGTEFMPDLEEKILLLESYGGTVPQIETYLRQLQQLGAFEKAAGILLGTFTQMKEEKCIPTAETLVREIAGKDLPIAVTEEIGHGTDSKGIVIGRELQISQS
ncbi:MAG: LD-carboxypeptidase [Lachnospiraceae bacterium]|nr:LD-carboxypeptidase [Lachnospiraceae bacterium]